MVNRLDAWHLTDCWIFPELTSMRAYPSQLSRVGRVSCPACFLWLPLLVGGSAAVAQGPFSGGGVQVSTYHNDDARTGRNLKETILTPATVNKDKFGKIRSLKVDGDVYAQPLYLSGLMIAGKARNVVFTATQHDSVYAFDGDDGTQLWKTSFLTGPNVTTLTLGDVRSADISPEIGITGTPVIRVDITDASKNTLYVVAKTKTVGGPKPVYEQRLHAIDVTTGLERPNSPVLIAAQANGTGTGWDIPPAPPTNTDNDGAGHVVFNPQRQNQRAGLVLSKRVIYITWSSHGDIMPYHGWVMGYDADTLKQVAVFIVTPNGGRAGVWQSAAAPAVDADGYLYFATGNGTFEQTLTAGGLPAQADFGDSVIKLAPDPSSTPASPNPNGWGLKVVDYFTPFDQLKIGGPGHDTDLGSGGVILLDDQPTGQPHLLAIAGKEGVIYLIDRDKMGKFDSTKDNVVARLPINPADASLVGDVFGMPTSFGSSIFLVGAPIRDAHGAPIGGPLGPNPMREFQLSGGKLTPAKSTTVMFGWKTCTPTVSASGTTNGIVWLVQAEGFRPTVPAILHAFDATDLGKELYNTEQAATAAGAKRDQPGIGIKFSIPTVANGKVYLGTVGEVTVYGPLGP
jgi:outer membrane protein assembly factor BamB